MAQSTEFTSKDASLAAKVALIAMFATLALGAASALSYSNANKVIAMICLVGSVISLLVWLAGFVGAFLAKKDKEIEALAAIFIGGYLLVGVLLIHPFLGVSEFYNRADGAGLFWAIGQFWSTVSFLDLSLIAASVAVSGIVCAILGSQLDWTTAMTSLGTGFLFVVVAGILLVVAAFVMAMAVFGMLAMIAAVSRAVQGN